MMRASDLLVCFAAWFLVSSWHTLLLAQGRPHLIYGPIDSSDSRWVNDSIPIYKEVESDHKYESREEREHAHSGCGLSHLTTEELEAMTRLWNESKGSDKADLDKRLSWTTTVVKNFFALQYNPDTDSTLLSANKARLEEITYLGLTRLNNRRSLWNNPNEPKLRAYMTSSDCYANEGIVTGAAAHYKSYVFACMDNNFSPNGATPMNNLYYQQPGVWLHEIAHEFASWELNNFSFEPIPAAYTEASNRGLYSTGYQYYCTGNNQWYNMNYGFNDQAYGGKNGAEYFAEATEAYYLINDNFPWNNIQLRRHDPKAWNDVGQWWGNPRNMRTPGTGGKSILVLFSNNCPFNIEVRWIDEAGVEKLPLPLSPGQQATIGTTQNDAFIIRHAPVSGGVQYEVQAFIARDFDMKLQTCDRSPYRTLSMSMHILFYTKLLNTDPRKPATCSDSNPNCPAWATNGECAKNPRYMLFNCRKSCNTCFYMDHYIQSLIDTPFLNGPMQ